MRSFRWFPLERCLGAGRAGAAVVVALGVGCAAPRGDGPPARTATTDAVASAPPRPESASGAEAGDPSPAHPSSDEDGADYRGTYRVQLPQAFFLARPDQVVGFTIDAHDRIAFADDVRALLDEHGVRAEVWALDGRLSVVLSWENDGSPEQYGFTLHRQGGGRRMDVVGAHSVSNDGEARLSPDPDAKLVSFDPSGR